MTLTSFWLVLMVGALCALPWLVKWIQRRTGRGTGARDDAIKLLSVLQLGPQQRVVTVEVGPIEARTQLVLGVTSQSVTCLHVLPCESARTATTSPNDFTQALQERADA